MSRICPLFSSSKGNSVYLSGGGSSLLIDAGVSFKQLLIALEAQNIDISHINGILVTHEHSDHIHGLKVLLKRTNIPLYTSRGTMEYLWLNGYIPAHTRITVCDGAFNIGEIEGTAFQTPHDASHSVGYRFLMPDGRRVGVATDLGHVSGGVRESLTGCDLVMLESNYDPGMLECSSYPYPLKRRIKSEFGHLSNDDCACMLALLAKCGTTRFVLGHLSEQNNIPELARQTAKAALDSGGLKENVDYTLAVAPPRGRTQTIVF
ncbi:MAG: MBL fold metallo-hydrolase [Oscillospiraceae bacterium]|nr:MBL fold metallo-hydrolase [Oscillospiraceae bacterium]